MVIANYSHTKDLINFGYKSILTDMLLFVLKNIPF